MEKMEKTRRKKKQENFSYLKEFLAHVFIGEL